MLEVVALGCERDQRKLFTGLTFRLRAGDMLRIQGPNGSGKTSLLRLLCGLTQPTNGRVELFGQTLARQRDIRASKLLWIGHAAGVKALLTVEENLTWLSALHSTGETAAIGKALAAVGLRGFEDTPCHALSAGQQRRIALARLYLPNLPNLWLLDEPFTALDTAGTEQLEAHLARHCDHGGTVVLTTHHELSKRACAYVDLDLGQYTS
ncbi:cytochrome c biogenesis heme-transporting ATPase CcmA [Herminiimonas aquatilis]|uniref:Cytochrome c biogenesis heme-transporting ATPase CcmA n=1 Tax=Herminiimonas aquatilis TaxID=345342 RepID=A0ABW2J6N0_9BURK|nr:cytochrome c biogenesis heme-transporting ATPase CcmA [Janthinobacterium sp. Marseille]